MAAQQRVGVKAYSNIIADRICERLVMGETLTSICRDTYMPTYITVMNWIDKPDEVRRPGFAKRISDARQAGYDYMADQIIDISNDSSNDKIKKMIRGKEVLVDNPEAVARDRLRIDARKWILCKRRPEIFGDKQQVEITGEVQLVARLAAARDRVSKITEIEPENGLLMLEAQPEDITEL